RHCWVCFATEREDRAAEWVCPCRCKGSTKWIHQACLQRWLDEKQKGNSTGSVSCPQCGTEYRIVFPKLGPLVYFLHQADRILSRASPFAMAGIVVGTVYWSAVTYGAVTVMQVVGHKKGLDVMERADPLFLLMGLPTIPVVLVLGRLIRWEDYVLRVWRKYSSKLQALQALVPGAGHRRCGGGPGAGGVPALWCSVGGGSWRGGCGARVCPEPWTGTAAGFISAPPPQGGITFVAIKGVLKVYFRQQQYLLQADRRILDYLE
ncbi:E3 ubiquitin-protein ligase MARCH5, partial [Chelonia mydas]